MTVIKNISKEHTQLLAIIVYTTMECCIFFNNQPYDIKETLCTYTTNNKSKWSPFFLSNIMQSMKQQNKGKKVNVIKPSWNHNPSLHTKDLKQNWESRKTTSEILHFLSIKFWLMTKTRKNLKMKAPSKMAADIRKDNAEHFYLKQRQIHMEGSQQGEAISLRSPSPMRGLWRLTTTLSQLQDSNIY